jgi:hypothetical protein
MASVFAVGEFLRAGGHGQLNEPMIFYTRQRRAATLPSAKRKLRGFTAPARQA